jgi:hypothetical protein
MNTSIPILNSHPILPAMQLKYGGKPMSAALRARLRLVRCPVCDAKHAIPAGQHNLSCGCSPGINYRVVLMPEQFAP